MKKAIISFLFFLALCLSVYAAQNAKFAYVDMTDHWANETAVELAEKEIFVGTKIKDKYYFSPDTTLTRTDFLVMLVSALGLDTESARGLEVPFEDFSEIPTYAQLYISAAYQKGLVDGNLENGKLYFRPFDVLTRIEIIKMMDKVTNTKAKEKAKYSDMYLVPKWGVDAVNNLTSAGVLNGYEDNTVRPYVKINRAMASEFLVKLIK